MNTPRRFSSGFSLVELMVALALSLFLIAGVVVMYFSTSETYHIQQQTAQIQERERLAATFVGSVVQSAGYFGAPVTYGADPAMAFPADSTFVTAGQAIYGTSATYSGVMNGQPINGHNDTLTVRLLAAQNDAVLNCLGFPYSGTTAQLYVNQFSLDTTNHRLRCTLSGPGLATQTQPLLDGVTSFQILYGIANGGGVSANEYVDANSVPDWLWVRSVRMMIEFAAKSAATGLPSSGTTPIKPVTFSAVFPIRPTSQ